VERYMIEQGYLIPSFHQSYWIGLNTTTPGKGSGANWTWVDFSDPPALTTYIAWGAEQPDDLEPPSACSQAASEYLGGDPEVWQWDDVQCATKSIAICRITRRRPCPQPGRAAHCPELTLPARAPTAQPHPTPPRPAPAPPPPHPRPPSHPSRPDPCACARRTPPLQRPRRLCTCPRSPRTPTSSTPRW
jgi:hypothetical protein